MSAAADAPPPDLPPLWSPPAGHNGGPPLDGATHRSGRPTISTPELREAILDSLADGVPARAICRVPGMPGRTTLQRWRWEDADFDRACRFAQRCGYEFLAEKVLDECERILERSGPEVARWVFNLRRQQLARMAPRFFGGE